MRTRRVSSSGGVLVMLIGYSGLAHWYNGQEPTPDRAWSGSSRDARIQCASLQRHRRESRLQRPDRSPHSLQQGCETQLRNDHVSAARNRCRPIGRLRVRGHTEAPRTVLRERLPQRRERTRRNQQLCHSKTQIRTTPRTQRHARELIRE